MNAKPLLFPILFGVSCIATKSSHGQGPQSKSVSEKSLCFVENRGQVTDQNSTRRSDINFRVAGGGLSLFTGNGKLHYQWTTPVSNRMNDDGEQRIATYRMDVTLVGANPNVQVVAEEQQEFYEQYYQPHLGLEGVVAHAYQKVTYKEIYPNIDWVLYVKNNAVEYDFVVHPGGKVSDIKLKYEGATNLGIDKAGRLTAITPMGTVTEHKPVSFQQDGKPIASSFVLQDSTLSFSTSPYNGTLIIDPILSWSTYYGGVGEEMIKGGGVTGDPYGNGYLCGHTNSPANIATTGSFKDTLTGQYDAFIVKFNSAGTRKWATYYGSTMQDYGWATTTDLLGHVYLVGYSNSNGLSTTGSHQAVKSGSYDAFLVQFDTAGSRQWATYYGGSAIEQAFAVTCDKSNNVYMTGFTNNSTSGIATIGAYQATSGGGNDAFLAKFNAAGVRQWATYYGGTSTDQGLSIKCDTAKNIFLAGNTISTSAIATAGSHQPAGAGNEEGFLVKFDSTGTRQWGTYYGGPGLDMCQGVSCDPKGNAYVTGYTVSTSGIATTGSFQPVFGGGPGADVYLVKFNGAGIRQWGTYYGGTDDDWGLAIASDPLGNMYLTGFTSSTSGIASVGAIKDTVDFQDAFVVKFDTTGARIWGTYFGGEDVDLGYGIYCNTLSQVYFGGVTFSLSNVSTTGSYQPLHAVSGVRDAYFALISDCDLTPPPAIIGVDTVCHDAAYTYTATPVAGAISYTWILPSGWTGASTTNTISLTTGSNSDTIRVIANFLCGSSIETKKPVTISPYPQLTPSGIVGVCNGDSITLVTSSGVSYQWLYGGTAINGATAQNYIAHNAGYYAAIVTNTYGCTDTSAVDTIIVHPLPVPVITASGTVLTTGTFSSYQWKHDGTAITGAVNSSYTITIMSGLYSVTVTDANGCEGTSEAFDARSVGIDGINDNNLAIGIYPNPVIDILYFQTEKRVSATISTIDGRMIETCELVQSIDMRSYCAGIYLLRITDSEGRLLSTNKIVKQANR